MEQTECSETSAYKIQTPGNYPEENIQHTEHGESLKSRETFTFTNFLHIYTHGYILEYYYYGVDHQPAYEDETECSETSAYKIQTPGNYPEENMQLRCPCSRK